MQGYCILIKTWDSILRATSWQNEADLWRRRFTFSLLKIWHLCATVVTVSNFDVWKLFQDQYKYTDFIVCMLLLLYEDKKDLSVKQTPSVHSTEAFIFNSNHNRLDTDTFSRVKMKKNVLKTVFILYIAFTQTQQRTTNTTTNKQKDVAYRQMKQWLCSTLCDSSDTQNIHFGNKSRTVAAPISLLFHFQSKDARIFIHQWH